MNSLRLYFSLLLALTASAYSAENDQRETLPPLPALVQMGWIPPHHSCAYILSGLHLVPDPFPFLPDGALFATLKGFHPDKLNLNLPDVFVTTAGDQVTLRGPFAGAEVERLFQKRRDGGHKPLNLGTFSRSYHEMDPVFGQVSLDYNMDAKKVALTPASADDLAAFEKRMNHQLRHSIGFMSLKLVELVLDSNRPKKGKVRVTSRTQFSATVLDSYEALLEGFNLEPEVALSSHFCFQQEGDREIEVSYEVRPEEGVFKIQAADNYNYHQTIEYTFEKHRNGLVPTRLFHQMRWRNFSADLTVTLFSHVPVDGLERGLERFSHHVEAQSLYWRERFYRRAEELTDGTAEMKTFVVQGQLFPVVVFYANLKDEGPDGRIAFRYSPALGFPGAKPPHPPDFISYNHIVYRVRTSPHGQISLTDSKGRHFEGGYQLKSITDYEVGEIPMYFFSIRGLP